jgi:hypothetical protein
MVQENAIDGDTRCNQPSPEWIAGVKAKVPLIHSTYWYQVEAFLSEKIAQRADGICIYESNDAVLKGRMIRIMEAAGYREASER